MQQLFSSDFQLRASSLSPGWVVLDRCGRHFSLVLNFLRDGTVPLPESQRELEEVLKEAQYYRLQGLIQHCLSTLQVSLPAQPYTNTIIT